MEETSAFEPLRKRLEEAGLPEEIEWEEGKYNYVAQLGVSSSDTAELLEIAREWLDAAALPADDDDGDEDDPAIYAPIHAWRCLAHLRQPQAIQPLLDMMGPMEDQENDWYLSEFPHVLGWIGAASIPALAAYLSEATHKLYCRIAAADSLREVARRHESSRQEVIRILGDELAKFETGDVDFNAFLIANLLDIRASEAAEAIERAYAANRVSLGITGTWAYARRELGVPGLGLVPKELSGEDELAMLDDFKEEYGQPQDGGFDDDPLPQSTILTSNKIGRNEPCPCGSGKKYKKCCGK